MTISYTKDGNTFKASSKFLPIYFNIIVSVASAGGFVFLKLLWRWHGSVYKLLWKDLLVFIVTYYLILVLYMFGLDAGKRKVFEALVNYCSKYGNFIPLSFVLGFFVSNVMTRWWNQYMSIPSPTSVAVFVSSTIHGYDEVGRAMRRTIMRYLCEFHSQV